MQGGDYPVTHIYIYIYMSGSCILISWPYLRDYSSWRILLFILSLGALSKALAFWLLSGDPYDCRWVELLPPPPEAAELEELEDQAFGPRLG